MHVRMYILPTEIYFQFWAASGSVRQREATSANTSVLQARPRFSCPVMNAALLQLSQEPIWRSRKFYLNTQVISRVQRFFQIRACARGKLT